MKRHHQIAVSAETFKRFDVVRKSYAKWFGFKLSWDKFLSILANEHEGKRKTVYGK